MKGDCNLTGVEVEFSNFIEIQEVEEIQFWPTQFWQRWDV